MLKIVISIRETSIYLLYWLLNYKIIYDFNFSFKDNASLFL
jgi:hypothetical protein